MEILHGWQQERRDLCSKLTHRLGRQIQLRHEAGVRASEEARFVQDRKGLSEDYALSAKYFLSETKSELNIVADLRACRTSAVLDIPLPADKGVKAIVTWLQKCVTSSDVSGLKLVFDFPGKNSDVTIPADRLAEDAHLIIDGRKQPPKSVRAILDLHGVRRFKSRKKVIEDLEQLTDDLIGIGLEMGWVK